MQEFLFKIALSGAEAVKSGISGISKVISNLQQKFKKTTNEAGKLASQFAKTFLVFQSVAQAVKKIASAIKSEIKYTIEMNRTLDQQAKTLKKTTEQARAHLLALKVMGKTYEEIQKDESLKKTYNDLIAIGKQLALPTTKDGKNAINELLDSFDKLKYIARYTLQWVYYYFQQYLKTSLKNTNSSLNDFIEKVKQKVPTWAAQIANVLSGAWLIIRRLWKDISHIWDIIKSHWDGMSDKTKGAILAIIAGLTLLLDKGLLLKGLFVGLIVLLDDFFTYLEGGDTMLGEDTWDGICNALISIYNFIANIRNAIADVINTICALFGMPNSELPFQTKWKTYDTPEERAGVIAGWKAEFGNTGNSSGQTSGTDSNGAGSSGATEPTTTTTKGSTGNSPATTTTKGNTGSTGKSVILDGVSAELNKANDLYAGENAAGVTNITTINNEGDKTITANVTVNTTGTAAEAGQAGANAAEAILRNGQSAIA